MKRIRNGLRKGRQEMVYGSVLRLRTVQSPSVETVLNKEVLKVSQQKNKSYIWFSYL